MFKLPDLPYDYSALEPYIDVQTMYTHHMKHHAAYVKNVNDALAKHEDLLKMDVVELLKNLDKVPEEVRTKVKNNAGGHLNHSMFWESLTPVDKYKQLEEKSELSKKITANLGSWSGFQEEFNFNAMQLFGSGWTWLVLNPEFDRLEIINMPLQDNPIMTGKKPILGLDLWEHAYYLKYKNVRKDYIDAFWNVINWKKIEENFSK